MADTSTQSDRFKEFGGRYFQRLVEGTAQVYGGKPADAVNLSPDEELDLWEKPTSPAAMRAYEIGASEEDARRANTLWANAMKGQQEIVTRQMQQQGAEPGQIQEALKSQGLTDDAIMATCRKHAYNLMKQNGHNSPKEEVAYAKRVQERAARRRAMTYQTVQGGGLTDATTTDATESAARSL